MLCRLCAACAAFLAWILLAAHGVAGCRAPPRGDGIRSTGI